MSFIEKKKRRFGDRRDGIWVKDAPGVNVIMAGLFPNRCDCEVCLQRKLDITKLNEYIEKKNASGQEHTTKLFHCIVAMLVRLFNARPRLNRFVRHMRIYERDEISVSFIVKRQFADSAEEALVTYKAKATDNIDSVSKFILGTVKTNRSMTSSSSHDLNKTIDKFAKLPRFILSAVCGFVRLLDRFGKVPKGFTEGDTSFTSILISNLGSIKCPSVYHHLNNYGTNSFMITIGTVHDEMYLTEEGKSAKRTVLDFSITLDERIADGFYFAKSLKVLDYLADNPELLDKPFEEDIEFNF